MNTNAVRNTNRSRFAGLRALVVLGLCVLTGLAANKARADVYVDKINTPSQQMGLPANDTALQFHVINSGSTAAANNRISITLQTWADGPTGKQFTLESGYFNLVAYQREWITVMIPASEYGKALKGLELKGVAKLHSHSYALDFHDNGAYNPWPPVPPAHLEISKVTPPAQQKNNEPFTVTVTNTGGEPSASTTLKVIMQPWADGPDGPATTKTQTVPVLQPGESKTFTFDAIDYNSDALDGNIYLNNVFEQDFSFWG